MLEREEKDLVGAQNAAADMETEKGHLQNDIKQFQQLIRSLEEHRVTTNNKLATSQAELESCEAEPSRPIAEAIVVVICLEIKRLEGVASLVHNFQEPGMGQDLVF